VYVILTGKISRARFYPCARAYLWWVGTTEAMPTRQGTWTLVLRLLRVTAQEMRRWGGGRGEVNERPVVEVTLV